MSHFPEIAALALIILGALMLIRRRRLAAYPWTAALALVVLTGLGYGAWARHLRARVSTEERIVTSLPRDDKAAGFVTSDTCKACHPQEHKSWSDSYHSTMTQRVTPESVLGDFNNVRLRAWGYDYLLHKRGDEFWVQTDDPDWDVTDAPGPPATRDYQVFMSTGSHHFQVYWAKNASGRPQMSLPFIYVKEQKRWVIFNSIFIVPPPIDRSQSQWDLVCIRCHTTAGVPELGSDAETHPDGQPLRGRVGELGIACESCHGPGEKHVASQRSLIKRYTQHLVGKPDPTIVNPARLPADRSSQVCGQCHSVFTYYDFEKWKQEGNGFRAGQDVNVAQLLVDPHKNLDDPIVRANFHFSENQLSNLFWSDGMPRTGGREYTAMIQSKCYAGNELSCLSCHSLHQSDPNQQLAHGGESDESCFKCHPAFREKVAEHTHHKPGTPGASCYNCHMPRTNYGLLKATRSHVIHSPSADATIETERPNACNLCHLDKTLQWTADRLKDWYGIQTTKPMREDIKTIAAGPYYTLKGDAAKRALVGWHMGWKPALDAAGNDWVAPYLAQMLDDPYLPIRYIAGRSLSKLPGFEEFVFDHMAPPEKIAPEKFQVMDRWARLNVTMPARPELFVEPGPRIDRAAYDVLLIARDNTPVIVEE